jgi:hypothetical protein
VAPPSKRIPPKGWMPTDIFKTVSGLCYLDDVHPELGMKRAIHYKAIAISIIL